MIIEVTGIGFPNKGAELMLRAVVEAVDKRLGQSVVLTCSPVFGSRASFRTIVDNGIYLQAKYYIRRFEIGSAIANRLPRGMLRMFGCYAAKEVDAVLDASGLRYSDKFGLPTAKRALRQYQQLKKRGGKVVLLPQAFGPLTSTALRETVRRICACADLVFARDEESLAVLQDVTKNAPNIRLAPDLTHLVTPEPVGDSVRWGRSVCIIPNTKMVSASHGSSGEKYLTCLKSVCWACLRRGHPVLVLNHEGPGDEALCRSIMAEFQGERIEFYQPPTAVAAKRAIGSVFAVVTSRYHGLVSALSQGVPALTTSWNHKYEVFLREYGVVDGIIKPDGEIEQLGPIVNEWLSRLSQDRHEHKTTLQNIAMRYKSATEGMWDDVFCVLATHAKYPTSKAKVAQQEK